MARIRHRLYLGAAIMAALFSMAIDKYDKENPPKPPKEDTVEVTPEKKPEPVPRVDENQPVNQK